MNFYLYSDQWKQNKRQNYLSEKYLKKIIRVCIKGIFLQSYVVQFHGGDKNTLKRNALQSIKGG